MSHAVSPLLHRIARDRRLTSRDLQVWIAVAAVLSVEEFISVKASGIAEDLQLHQTTVSRCLHRLAALGYIDRGRRGGQRGAMRLRLPRAL